MDNLGYSKIPQYAADYIPVEGIDTVEFLGENIEEIVKSINSIPTEVSSLNSLTEPITIASIPVKVPGDQQIYKIYIQIEPTQDFINEPIIENIRKTGDIHMLSLTVDSSEVPVSVHGVIKSIEKFPDLCNAIIHKYCDVVSYATQWAEHQRPLLAQRRKTSNQVYTLLYKDFPSDEPDPTFEFKPETYDLVTDSKVPLHEMYLGKKFPKSYQVEQKKLVEIGRNFHGFEGANKTIHFLKQKEALRKEIEKNVILPIHQGQKEIQLDTKYFYMDNGHHLYKDILYKSPYHDYLKKDIELIENTHSVLAKHINRRYYALGTGDGRKDFALLRHTPIEGHIILMDGSAKSLQEAEILFTGTSKGYRGATGHLSNVKFTQNRIDDLLVDGSISTASSMFVSPHENPFRMPDIRETSNTFGMFGGTYGNFSSEYKKQFIRNMDAIMNPGDNIFLSVFKIPENMEGIKSAIAHYSSPEVSHFVKNNFIKLGIPQDKIEVKVSYEDDTIHIDALVRSDLSDPTYMNFDGNPVALQGDTTFRCFHSKRMNDEKMSSYVEGTSLEVVDSISEEGNPFTIYVIEKK